MINIESICEKCLKKDGCQTYKELKEVTEIYLVDACEKYIKDVNAVLEQIRAEIQKVLDAERDFTSDNAKAQAIALSWCLEIIDRYTKGENG